MVVVTTGYFVTVVGPYLSDAKNNDAFILKHMTNVCMRACLTEEIALVKLDLEMLKIVDITLFDIPAFILKRKILKEVLVDLAGVLCCCPGHMYQDNFTSEAVSQVKSTYAHSILNRTSILDLIRKLRHVALHNEQSRIDLIQTQLYRHQTMLI
jgi:hypothetical protein